MDEQQRKFERMTQTPVRPLILKLAVPTVLSMLVTTFYNMADTFFVGMLDSDSITGAVGVVFSVMSVIQAVGFFFGHGSGNYVSRELGKHNVSEAEKMVSVGFFTALIAGGTLGVSGLIFIDPLSKFLGATDTILPYAKQYMAPILIGAPFMCASLVLNNQLRFQGNAFYAMLGIVSGAVLNIGLDPLLIFTFDMGIAGAAWATVISQFVSFCLLLAGVQKSDTLKVRLRNFSFKWEYIRNIASGGTPSLCRQGIGSLATICLNHMAGPYGDAAVAAFSVVQRIMMFASSALIGFGQGFQPVCGFNWGANRFDRVKEAFRFCIRVSVVAMIILAVVGYCFAPTVVGWFRDGAEVRAIGAKALRAQLVVFPLMGWVFLSNMMLQTIGRVFKASLLAMARQGLAFIPIVLVLPRFFELNGLIWAQAAADVCAFLIALPIQLSVLREMEQKMMEQEGVPC